MSDATVVTHVPTRGEQVTGLVWLSLGALLSLLLEVVYLNVALTISGRSVVLPLSILAALWFNGVLTKTARLWSANPLVGAVPLIVWAGGFVALLIVGEVGSIAALGDNIRSVLLLFAGIAGGVWPFVRRK